MLCVCSFVASFGGWIKVIEKCERECFFPCFRTCALVQPTYQSLPVTKITFEALFGKSLLL